MMKRVVLYPVVLVITLVLIGCQLKNGELQSGDIRYELRFPNAEHNEADITLILSDLDPIPIKISMSRTSPGRYALHEFTKNVYGVTATNADGDTLEIFRPNLHNWIVSGHDGTVRFQYTLYADHADGTYSGVNPEHAHLNIPATLVWARGLEDEPVTLQFFPPEDSNWKVATQLIPTDDPYTFEAPDFYYLMDSPTELSDLSVREWTVPADTTRYTIRLALHHDGTEEQLDHYADMARKVVDEQIAVYGEPPAYDYGSYTFIADYLPYVYGDGMEHRNSTILTSTRTLEDPQDALRNLYTLSHEYFHGWNVERMRPQSLQPFHFQEANMSGALWFAEGFTSYYDDLIIRRAGLINDREYGEGWSGTLNSVLNSPGNRFYNPIEMSMQAPFVDAATSVDAQNKRNTFISYYSWGAVIGLGLDLSLRSVFNDVTLDDYMRAVWEKHGNIEQPYRISDLQQILGEVTDSTEFAGKFFARHIYGSEMPGLDTLLAKAGFELRKAFPGKAVLHFGEAIIDFEATRPTITKNTLIGSPMYEAGVDRDDVLLRLDGKQIENSRELNRILASHKPGEQISITYESLGESIDTTLTLAEDPTLEMVPYENISKEMSPDMQSFRQRWLESKNRQVRVRGI